MEANELLAIMFGVTALIGAFGGVINRIQTKKGIGAQFIKFMAIAIALPAAVSLAFLGLLGEAVTSIIVGVLAYSFPGATLEG